MEEPKRTERHGPTKTKEARHYVKAIIRSHEKARRRLQHPLDSTADNNAGVGADDKSADGGAILDLENSAVARLMRRLRCTQAPKPRSHQSTPTRQSTLTHQSTVPHQSTPTHTHTLTHIHTHSHALTYTHTDGSLLRLLCHCRDLMAPLALAARAKVDLIERVKRRPLAVPDLLMMARKLGQYSTPPPEYDDASGQNSLCVPGYMFPCPDTDMMFRTLLFLTSAATASAGGPATTTGLTTGLTSGGVNVGGVGLQVKALPPNITATLLPEKHSVYALNLSSSLANASYVFSVNMSPFRAYDAKAPPLLQAPADVSVQAFATAPGYLPSELNLVLLRLVVQKESPSTTPHTTPHTHPQTHAEPLRTHAETAMKTNEGAQAVESAPSVSASADGQRDLRTQEDGTLGNRGAEVGGAAHGEKDGKIEGEILEGSPSGSVPEGAMEIEKPLPSSVDGDSQTRGHTANAADAGEDLKKKTAADKAQPDKGTVSATNVFQGLFLQEDSDDSDASDDSDTSD